MAVDPTLKALRLFQAFLLLGTVGCAGGGPTAPLPVVTGVTTIGTLGETGATVTFESNVSGGADGFAWDFGGGANPATSDHENPEVRLGEPGTYHGTLVVSQRGASTEPFAFEYTVIAPRMARVLAVTPSGTAGVLGTGTVFRAEVNGEPTMLHWTFDGGVTPRQIDALEPLIILEELGTFTGRVSVSNAYGTSLPFEFTFEVVHPDVPVVTAVTSLGEEGPYLYEDHSWMVAATNSPTSYEWNFTHNRTYHGQTLELNLRDVGTFEATVTATNAAGTSLPFSFTYTVTVHPMAATILGILPATEHLGHVGESVTLSLDYIDPNGKGMLASWEFFGGVYYDTHGLDVELELNRAGTWEGAVSLYNGVANSGWYYFTYTIGEERIPPVINRVVPSGDVGRSGDEVVFAAETQVGVKRYEWDFDGGAVPNTSTETWPHVTLGEPDNYRGSVTAYNHDGASESFSFDFSVEPGSVPHGLRVTPNENNGLAGDIHQFLASGADGADTWHWTFASGAFPREVSGKFPSALLTEPGNHYGLVTATNSFGTSAPLKFGFTVDGPAVPRWQDHVITSVPGKGPAAAVIDGRPAVGYCGPEGGYFYSYATTSSPQEPSDWIAHQVAGDAGSSAWVELVDLNGRPAMLLSANQVEPSLQVAQAQVDVPQSGEDWLRYPLTEFQTVAPRALAARDGRLEFIGHVSQRIFHGRALNPNPASEDGWRFHTVRSYNTKPDSLMLTSLNGSPAFARLDDGDLRIGLALVSEPTGEVDWQHHSLPDAYIGTLGLMERNDRLICAYPGAGQVRIGLARIAFPGSSTAWSIHQAASDAGYRFDVRVLEFGGRLAVAHNAKGVWLRRALNDPPTVAADWVGYRLAPTGTLVSAFQNDDQPAVIYVANNAVTQAPELHYATSDEIP